MSAGFPIRVWVTVKIGIRKSWSRRKKAALLGQPCTGKPDNDNIENCVFDALTGHLERKKKSSELSPGEREVAKRRERVGGLVSDDAQIAFNQTEKIWSEPEEAGLYVTLRTGAYEDPKDAALRAALSVLKRGQGGHGSIRTFREAIEEIEKVLNE